MNHPARMQYDEASVLIEMNVFTSDLFSVYSISVAETRISALEVHRASATEVGILDMLVQ